LRYASGLICLLLGLAVVAMAIPRTVAAWIALGSRPAMVDLQVATQPTGPELAACVDAYERALQWMRPSTRLANLGSCEFALALAMPADDPDRAHWLTRAEEHHKQVLQMNPADAFAGCAWRRCRPCAARPAARS
jgi:hypothetical protein